MGKGKRNQKLKEKLETYPLEKLLKKAQENINTFNYKEAQILLQEALKKDPDDLKALETSASLCLETGNIDGAKRCLGRAITLAPDNGFSKYFSMGQLLKENDSLQCYLKGIELINQVIEDLVLNEKENENNLKAQNESPENKDDKTTSEKSVTDTLSSLHRKLSNAYCAVAELYMSDLCDEPEAEVESLSNVQKAINADSSNPEAYQHYANFLVVKGEFDSAKENIKKSVSLWLPKYLEVDNGEAVPGSFDPIEVCPLSQSARFGTSRILIELEEYNLADDVLETLLDEDEKVVYTWYLLGWNHYLQGDTHRLEAKQHFEKALEVHCMHPSTDANIIEHMYELLEELKDVRDDDDDDTGGLEGELEEMEVS